MSNAEDIIQLIEHNIPDGRKQLQDSYTNLERVADYCQRNYLQTDDKGAALKLTQNYTTQSLASVAYQINMLSTDFLRMLDMQLNHLQEMESSVNHLAQTVAIHKEKVARREIGVLTTNKSSMMRPPGMKHPGIIFPEQTERAIKYVRKPIDYSTLDDVGHGVKTQQIPMSQRSGSISAASGASVAQQLQRQGSQMPAGVAQPAGGYSSGTLGRQSSASPYRQGAPPPAAPALPPSQYAPGMMGGGGVVDNRRSNYAPPSNYVPGVPQPSPYGVPQIQSNLPAPLPEDLPPPPESAYQTLGSVMTNFSQSRQLSHMSRHAASLMYTGNDEPLPAVPDFLEQENSASSDWIPKIYLEKVVAVYDYNKEREDELSFKEGAVIYVIKKNDDGWYEGCFNGVTGLFPGNYVESCIN